MQQPDARNHLIVSLVKSGLRIVAGISLMFFGSLVVCGGLIILAEILGIVEELV